VIRNFLNLNRSRASVPRRNTVQATIAVAFAAAAGLAAFETEANAGAREIGAASYGFADSLVPTNALERLPELSPSGSGGVLSCLVNCGPLFGTFVVRRNDLVTSNTADVSARRTVDGAGRPLGVSGMVVVERLEPDGLGLLANWVVVSERTADENGSHSWSLLPGGLSDAPWRPSHLYRFEGSSFSVDLAGGAAPTPEASTWIMMLIGFGGLSCAGYRSSSSRRLSTVTRKGVDL
jgi:hypothetical protein